jgi:hypothetical protein
MQIHESPVHPQASHAVKQNESGFLRAKKLPKDNPQFTPN